MMPNVNGTKLFSQDVIGGGGGWAHAFHILLDKHLFFFVPPAPEGFGGASPRLC